MLAYKRASEAGFTLVELLVVIAIIAILTAIAVPAFLNQRKKANDASVRSDVKSVVTEIETRIVEESGLISSAMGPGYIQMRIATVNPTDVKLSNGVSVVVQNPPSHTNHYTIHAYHANGSKYVSASPLVYDSAAGGFTN